jgi:hypothetical protein
MIGHDDTELAAECQFALTLKSLGRSNNLSSAVA